ncbi:MAG: heavy metal-associated domain-containing protein [Phycisphaerales bacterium]|nr:heavy metal-associated domain-containing protein [Phycisphaerales bacterium]
MRSRHFYFITLLLITALTAGSCTDDAETTRSKSTPTPVNYTIDVTGMHCDACAQAIDAYLREMPGVIECQVSYEEGVAKIEADDQASAESLTQAIEMLGFQAEVEDES